MVEGEVGGCWGWEHFLCVGGGRWGVIIFPVVTFAGW